MNSLPTTSKSPLVRATLVAGTLDLISALSYAALAGKNPLAIPVGIASGIWPGAVKAGAPALLVGVLLHFLIMLAMVAAFLAAARRVPWLTAKPIAAGLLYGLLLWAVMNLIVLPLRWPALFPHFTALSFGEQIFSHTMLVGLPIAWLASRAMRQPAS